MKKLLSIAALVMAVQAPQAHASDENALWKGLNVLGGIGSAASFIYWAETFPYLPRLALDATCVGTSVYGNKKSMAPLAIALNIGCLVGSAYSLWYWMPAIMAHLNSPLFVARGVIDLIQIGLTTKRLYDAAQNTES